MLSNARRLKASGIRLLLGKKMIKVFKMKSDTTQNKKGLFVHIGKRNGFATLKAMHVTRY